MALGAMVPLVDAAVVVDAAAVVEAAVGARRWQWPPWASPLDSRQARQQNASSEAEKWLG